MTRSTAETCTLVQPRLLGALLLGAALTVMPLTGFAQTSTQPADAGAAPSEAGSAGAATASDSSASSSTAGDAAAAADGADGTSAAAGQTETVPETQSDSAPGAQAAALLKGADGTDHGSVTASDTPSGALYVILNLTGLPAERHAVHIHETGQCDGPTFESAGGHLAGGKEHGVLSAGGMHTGDLPNVTTGEGGLVTQEFFLPGVALSDVMDDDGGAFIVHSGVDDYTTQPAGNAGDRIACGVFQATTASN